MTVLSTPPRNTEYSGVRQHRCSSTLDFGVEGVKGTAKSSLPLVAGLFVYANEIDLVLTTFQKIGKNTHGRLELLISIQ